MAVIKLTNNVQLDQASLYGVTAIDTTNVIATKNNMGNNTSYTATEDCFLRIQRNNSSGYGSVSIDNVAITGIDSSSTYYFVPFKKGQVVKIGSASMNIIAWGLKK